MHFRESWERIYERVKEEEVDDLWMNRPPDIYESETEESEETSGDKSSDEEVLDEELSDQEI